MDDVITVLIIITIYLSVYGITNRICDCCEKCAWLKYGGTNIKLDKDDTQKERC